MITFKKFLLEKEDDKIFGPPNEEKFEMWERVKGGEMSEDEFLKLIGFEKFKPNSEINVETYNKSEFHVIEYVGESPIHMKSFYKDQAIADEVWKEYDAEGRLTRSWDNRGNESLRERKTNEKGELTKTLLSRENGKLIIKRIEVFADGDSSKPLYYYYEDGKGVKDELKYEHRYDENSNLIYFKQTTIFGDYVPKNDTYEKVMEYWENGKLKNENIYQNGELDVKRSSSYTQNGTKKVAENVSKAAEERARGYNEKYHGIFLHSASKYDVRKLIRIKEKGQKAEICVSTLRSNTVFQSGGDRVVIVGFGNIRELYDYDSYSEIDEDGSRYATKTLGDSLRSGLHDMDKDYEGYNEKYHYDEGFMDFSNAEVVAVFADFNNVIKNWVCLDGGYIYNNDVVYKRELPKIYKNYVEHYRKQSADKLKVTSFKECVKKIDPNIKVIGLDKFNSLQNSEELMRLMYDLKERKEDKEIMKEPFQKYEENNKIMTFKKYILLQEFTRELMPQIYSELEKHDDPLVGVHFTKGIEDERSKKTTPQIGINPRPRHFDPIGIYAFPKDYVLSGKLEHNTMFEQYPYYYIVRPSSKAKILNLSTMTYDEARELLIKMGIDSPNGESWLDSKEIYHHSKGELKIGHKFWGVLERARKQLKNKGRNSSWNVLLKDSGYNVLYDEGDGIINPAEPAQVVYLESSAMEVLDQGKQDDTENKIYSFFIENFPDLRPEKTKTHWGRGAFILHSKDGYRLKIFPDFEKRGGYDRVAVQIISDDRNNEEEMVISLSHLFMPSEYYPDQYIVINQIKNKIEEMQKDGRIPKYEKTEYKTSNILKSISERFNIKLKPDEDGTMEIRQKYQDGDKDYVVIFYIREHRDELYFVLKKDQTKKVYNTFSYHLADHFQVNESDNPEEVVKKGLDALEKKAESSYENSLNKRYAVTRTLEFLRKRVFGL